MESNERLVLRLPSDLKAMFSTLCESEGVTVSSKIKAMMINELNQKLISVKLQTIPKSMPRKPKNIAKNDFSDVKATTPLESDKGSLEGSKMSFNDGFNKLLELVDDDTEINHSYSAIPPVLKNNIQSAINAQNRRKNEKKKR